jgi:serine/threonine-protein kinase
MASRTNLQDRYELREELGKGGMGVVYRAWDTLMQREVALKTILDVDNPAIVDMFYKEWGLLTGMTHPNVIAIYDIGEFEHEGLRKPYFVMPLLPGVTLDKLIRDGSPRLTVETVVDMAAQAARGLQAAHEMGLIHRDIKPSNIFVLDDDSVKIIDFGIARAADRQTKTTLKGTLSYLSPEQLQMKPPSPQSDIYALGVVCYEALTRRRPFRGTTEEEVVNAILHGSAPPASEINPNVKFALSQVIHKAMAKQPWHRYGSAREFGDALTKGLRGEALDYFDATKVKPRLERASQAFESGDHAFANELLAELEGEGHLDPEVGMLRRRLDQTLRQARIKQLLDSARRFFEAQEYTLALRKIQEGLETDPDNVDVLTLKNQIEIERRQKKIGEWIGIAHQHLDNNAFRQAREALENVLKVKSTDADALNLMAEVRRRENEFEKAREEKSRLYQNAMNAWEKGDMTSALSKLEVLLKLEDQNPDTDSARSSTYQNFYNQVHSEHDTQRNGYDEARKLLSDDKLDEALALCARFLTKYPNHALFQALKYDVEERQRQALSALIAETDRKVEEESDLDRRVAMIETLLKQYPEEPHFERALRVARDKRDLVNSIVAKARFLEERGQFQEACDQWQILRSIHERYPGLAFEIERLMKRRDHQTREDSKSHWVKQVDQYLEEADYERAGRALASAQAEFPDDHELLELAEVLRKCRERDEQSKTLVAKAREYMELGAWPEALDLLRQALAIEPRNPVVRSLLINTLIEYAHSLLKSDTARAEQLLGEVLGLEAGHAEAQNMLTQISDLRREEFIVWCMTQARRMQGDGDVAGALAIAAQGLAQHPNDQRLQRLQAALQRTQTSDATQTVVTGFTEPSAPKAAPVAPPPPPVVAPPPPPAAAPPPVTKAVAKPAVPAPPPAAPMPAAKPAPEPAAPSGFALPAALEPYRKFLIPAAALVVVFLVLGGVALTKMGGGDKLETRELAIQTSIDKAEILVDDSTCGFGRCLARLKAGTHKIETRLTGYLPVTQNVQVSADSKVALSPVLLTLAPRLLTIFVSTDLKGASAKLDDVPAGDVQAGALRVDNVPPGAHRFEISAQGASVAVGFLVTPGAVPMVNQLTAQGTHAFALTGLGPLSRVYSSTPGAAVQIDQKPAGTLEGEGLVINYLNDGAHAVDVALPKFTPWRLTFEAGQAPVLHVLASAGTAAPAAAPAPPAAPKK